MRGVPTAAAAAQVEREIRIHAALRHAHVMPLYGAFEEAGSLHLVMRYAALGSVFEQLGSAAGSGDAGATGTPARDAFAARAVLAPTLRALAYLHARGVVHRDVKPENLVRCGNGTLLLADFGFSTLAADGAPATRVGTPAYMARCPDVLPGVYLERER